MGLFAGLNTSASGMTAQRLRLDAISNNLANASTTRTAEGGPYRRQMPVFAPGQGGPFARLLSHFLGSRPEQGVVVAGIVQDNSPPRLVYEPDHPDARDDGYVEYPNVNAVLEMTDLISATRAYEANGAAFNASKAMASQALELGR